MDRTTELDLFGEGPYNGYAYTIFERDELMYAGITMDCDVRMMQHKESGLLTKDRTVKIETFTEDRMWTLLERMDLWEFKTIRYRRPKLNRRKGGGYMFCYIRGAYNRKYGASKNKKQITKSKRTISKKCCPST